MNLIKASVENNGNSIFLGIDGEQSLHIPYAFQSSVKSYTNRFVLLGIDKNFVSISENRTGFNCIDAKLTNIEVRKNTSTFTINDQIIILKNDINLVRHDIGRVFSLNFDTEFAHIFDIETENNLTL